MRPLNGRFRALVESIAIYLDEFRKIPSYQAEANRWMELRRRVTSGQTDLQTPLTERKTD